MLKYILYVYQFVLVFIHLYPARLEVQVFPHVLSLLYHCICHKLIEPVELLCAVCLFDTGIL